MTGRRAPERERKGKRERAACVVYITTSTTWDGSTTKRETLDIVTSSHLALTSWVVVPKAPPVSVKALLQESACLDDIDLVESTDAPLREKPCSLPSKGLVSTIQPWFDCQRETCPIYHSLLLQFSRFLHHNLVSCFHLRRPDP